MPLFTQNNAVVLPKQCHCLSKTMRLFLQNNGIVLNFKGSLVKLKAYYLSSKSYKTRTKLDFRQLYLGLIKIRNELVGKSPLFSVSF